MSSRSSTPGGGFQAGRLLLVPAAACIALVAPGAASSQSPPDPLAGLSLPGSAAYRALGASEGPASPAERPTPAEVAASRTAYMDLSDGQALALLRDEHDSVVEADAFPELHPPLGDEVTYQSPFTAVIGDDLPAAATDDPAAPSFDPGRAPLLPGEGARNVLVESTVPMAAPERGHLAPVDGDLASSGDSFTVENAAVEPEMPVDLADGIALEEADATVTPASTDGAEAVPVADKLFYASSDTDTDTLVTPTPTGVEIFFQLRSPDAPAANAIDLDLPAGADLTATADGGAAVVENGETLIAIPPASAWDAAQRRIAVRYQVAGNRLTVVADTDAATLWPVVVDPILDYYPWGDTGPRTDPNLTNWYPQNIGGRPINQFFAGEQGGVMNRFTPGWFANGDWAQWVATPIRESYIETVQFWNVSHGPTAPGSCAWMAIWSGTNWTWGGVWDGSAGTAPLGTGAWRCGPVNHVSYAHYTGSDPYPDGEGYGDPESADGSVGIFGLYQNGSGTRTASADDVLRSATVWRGDRNYPTVTSVPGSSWTQAPWVAAQDPGLGVAGVGVRDLGTGRWIGGGGPGCQGDHTSICPASAAFPLDLIEGRHTVDYQAFDPLWNASWTQTSTVSVDKTPPDVALSGGLSTATIEDGESLHVDATDGNPAATGGSAMRSGVRSIVVRINGSVVANTGDVPCTRTIASCPLALDYTAGAIPENAHFKVTVTDQLGQSTVREWDVNPICAYDLVPNGPADSNGDVPAVARPAGCYASRDASERAAGPGSVRVGEDWAFPMHDDSHPSIVWRAPHPCGQPYGGGWKVADLPDAWNDRIQSAVGYHNCGRFIHYYNNNFDQVLAECSLSFQDCQSFDDQTSSLKFRAR